MVMLLAEIEGLESVLKYKPALEKEYQFWMKGTGDLSENIKASKRTVRMTNGTILNRYWDDIAEPRPESYKEDYELAEGLPEDDKRVLYRNLKAGAESGWDFSSRWFEDHDKIASIMTTELVPIDLNCLIYHLEYTIGQMYEVENNKDMAMTYFQKAEKRQTAINDLLWNEEFQYYADYDLKNSQKSDFLTAATATPLFFKVASKEQAAKIAEVIEERLLQPGGLATTLSETGQQWDFPNGWAPLQWIAIKGLINYGHDDLAKKIASRWLQLNRNVFAETGKMMEKYNVADLSVKAGGGEYALQDGFGWTNGVALSIIAEFEDNE